MTPEDITARIRTALPDAEVRVVDTTGGGDHFSATVVSSAWSTRRSPRSSTVRARRFTPWR